MKLDRELLRLARWLRRQRQPRELPMNTLTKEQIEAAEDLDRELVEVPEWGGSVWVQEMSGAELDEYQQSQLNFNDEGNFTVNLKGARARACAISMKDEQGQRLFGDEEVAALARKSGKALDRVYDVAERLSGLNKKKLEDSVKNSDTTTDDDSG